MRTPPTAVLHVTAATAASQIIHLSHPLLSSTTSNSPPLSSSTLSNETHQIRWRHYSGTKDFEANAALVLIILLCALICALALNASIRCFLRGGGGGHAGAGAGNYGGGPAADHFPRRSQTDLVQLQQKIDVGAPLESAPAVVYSAGMKTKLAGVEAECVICLSEFVEGEEIRVLGWCKHGFHSKCIQEWFLSHSSCPTCRRSFRPPSPSPLPSSSSTSASSALPVGEALTARV